MKLEHYYDFGRRKFSIETSLPEVVRISFAMLHEKNEIRVDAFIINCRHQF